MATYIAPLNLKYIFINTFSGNSLMFSFLFFLALSILAGQFKMKNSHYGMLIVLGALMLYSWIGQGIMVLIIIFTSVVIFYLISKITKD